VKLPKLQAPIVETYFPSSVTEVNVSLLTVVVAVERES